MTVVIMTSGSGFVTSEIAKIISEELLSRHKLHDINQDLPIVNSEEINLTESTNGHPATEKCVEDIKTYILHLHANARY